VPVVEQIAVLAAVNEGMLDDVPLDRIGEAETVVRKAFVERLPGLADRVRQGARLSDEDRQSMRDVMGAALAAADLRSTGGPKRDG
jgi:F-type H+-transporting ATPase subunit alpha